MLYLFGLILRIKVAKKKKNPLLKFKKYKYEHTHVLSSNKKTRITEKNYNQDFSGHTNLSKKP